ncbi:MULTISPECIES: nickel ABC transporter permease [Paraliobacillus]|uniref:nickel ABC transporter permease n=1 Tax=Paraliobacillus TaxID=200903 RepID=UPI000DD3AD14|nr:MULTISPECIES: nickel ABC transporter permease [Paraliobacillus]
MFRIISRRLIEVLIFVLIITFISFLFIRLAPGDPIMTILNADELAVTQNQIESLREEMGFNEPLLIQYVTWLWRFIQFDLGDSFVTGQPVMELILGAVPATLELTIGSTIVMLLIAIPLGSLAAIYRNSWIDQFSRALSVVGAAIPSFWLGLLLIDLLAVEMGFFPTMGRDGFLSLLLPSITLGLAISSVYVRLLRSSLLESLNQDFIKAARARGLSSFRIFFFHAFRSALPPVITVFGVSIGSLIGGVVVVEVLFAYPGIGKLVVDSIKQRDYPIIQGYILIMAIIVFSVNTLVDLSYYLLNPEARLREKETN